MTDSEVIEVLEKEESYMLSHGGDRQAKALRIAIDKIKQEPKWIPVTERLPEAGKEATRCLVTVDCEGVVNDYTAIRTYFSDTKDFNDVVTAWMPLPQPYKAESEGRRWK